MSGPIVALDNDRVAVEPGGQVTVTVTITNTGSIVEGYWVEVIGEGVADWGQAMPAEISVYPQQDATAVVVFSPPGGTGAPGGTWPFGIRVRSTEDIDASTVAEGDLEIGKVFGLQAKLMPVNSTGRWRGVHVVQFSNWGNSPVTLNLSATNEDQALGFLIRPEQVELALGATGTARIWAKTKKPFLRGTPTRIPFTVVGEQPGAAAGPDPANPYLPAPDRPSVTGAFNQKPILTKLSVTIAGLSLIAIIGSLVWAFTRPGPAEATFQELGPPEVPADVKAAPAGPDSILVSWSPVANVESYSVAEVLPDGKIKGSKPVPVPDTALTVDKQVPGVEACFAVQAVRGKLVGPLSEKQCATIPAATPTPSVSGSAAASGDPGASAGGGAAGGGAAAGGGGAAGGGAAGGGASAGTSNAPGGGAGGQSSAPAGAGGGDAAPNPSFKGKWFAADLWTVANTTFDPPDRLAKLKAEDQRAGLVKNTVYPNMQPKLQAESWVLYLGPFDTQAEALAACSTVRKVQPSCLAVQLDP